jgi:hypothetical protein
LDVVAMTTRPPVTRVDLTDDDRALAHAFFLLMREVKPNVRRTLLNARDREDYETAGKLGEIGFGRALSLPVDWTVSPHRADGGTDFLLRDGRTVDVKSVSVQANLTHDYKLTFGDGELRADVAVLALVAPGYQWVELAGALTRAEFFARSVAERGWTHRGEYCPRVVQCSQMHDWRTVVGAWILDDEEVA